MFSGAGVEVRVGGNATTAGRIIGWSAWFLGIAAGGRGTGEHDPGFSIARGEGDIDFFALRGAAFDVGDDETDKAADIIFGRQIGLGSGLSTFKVFGGGVPEWQIVNSPRVPEYQ